MTTKDVAQTKEKTGQKEAVLSVAELAKKIGVTPKRLRSHLRAKYPRDVTGQKWAITASLAKKIEKDYKAKDKAKEKVDEKTEKTPEANNAEQGK
jgi:hypothetical protein